jgi:hypothetical protein
VEDWERKTIEDLRWLHKDDRAQVIAVMKAMIENMPKRPAIKYDSKGKTPSSVEETLALAEVKGGAEILREDAGGSGGAAPNVPKGPRRGAAATSQKQKRIRQTPVPKRIPEHDTSILSRANCKARTQRARNRWPATARTPKHAKPRHMWRTP